MMRRNTRTPTDDSMYECGLSPPRDLDFNENALGQHQILNLPMLYDAIGWGNLP
jgi:hypothetical protein